MQGIITDQHLIERDRLGRTLTFMARIVADGWAAESKAIAIDRETAVLVDGRADRPRSSRTPTIPRRTRISSAAAHRRTVAAKTPLTYLNLEVQRAAPGSTFDLKGGEVQASLNMH